MTPPLVKICGVTTPADALAAVDAGADAVGLNFWPGSARHIDRTTARAILDALPWGVERVGVFVDEQADVVNLIAKDLGLTMVQFHGDEPPHECARCELPLIKAVAVRGLVAPEDVADLHADILLFDAPTSGRGGSGQTFPWSDIAAVSGVRRVMVAGGLTPENVAQAIAAVQPAWVDVASGVESSPRVKDVEKMRRFVAAVRATG